MSETISNEDLELDSREADGIKIDLLYRRVGNVVLVRVFDERQEQGFEVAAPPDKALDVFHHPFAYAGDQAA
jgi:hypothetical protein